MIKSYNLIQYSPMIHFQHDQKGACLRATELKPKLDKWINNKLENKRYKLKVISQGEQILKNNHKMYFGNMKSEESFAKEKLSIYNPKQLILNINTFFDTALAKEIESALPYCFAFENFGTRQSKGFGSFYSDQFIPIETCYKNKQKDYPIYYFETDDHKDRKKAIDNALDSIQALYKAMKSGINEEYKLEIKNKYMKSLLWKYFNDEKYPSGFNWEKRIMKQKLMNKKFDENELTSLYIRGLLGLTNSYTFRKTYKARMDKDYNDDKNGKHFKLNKEETFLVNHSEIERFKSPITFKPFKNKVYIILHELNIKSIQNKTFNFENKSSGEFSLTIPDKTVFSLKPFMDFVCDKINKNQFGGKFTGKSASLLKNMDIRPL